MQAKSEGRPLPFCCLLKLRIFFNDISYLFRIFVFRSSFSVNIVSLINQPLLILFTNFSFLFCLALSKSVTKNDGF